MNSKEAGERFKVLNAYNNSQEIRHLSLKQEKKLFAERKIRGEEVKKEYKEICKEEAKIYLNHLPKKKGQLIGWIYKSELTEEIENREIDYINK